MPKKKHGDIPVAFQGIYAVADKPIFTLFLGNEDHVLLIFIDEYTASVIGSAAAGKRAVRPQTHELFGLLGLGMDLAVTAARIARIVDGTFHGELTITQHATTDWSATRIQTFDARASDIVALALLSNIPITVDRDVFQRVARNRSDFHFEEGETQDVA